MSGPGMVVYATEFNISAPGANTDILSAGSGTTRTTAITPDQNGTMVVTIALSTQSVFNVTMTSGGTTHTVALNDGTALDANELYSFSFLSSDGIAYNFQVATDSVIENLIVANVVGGVV